MVGSLNYFSTTTRYDISHAVSRLGQMAARPTKGAAKAMGKVLRYLRANHLQIEGKVTAQNLFECYSDSDHAGDRPVFTQSQTGTLITLNGSPIQWASRKQIQTTATSSALAEIYALSETVRTAQLTAWRLQHSTCVSCIATDRGVASRPFLRAGGAPCAAAAFRATTPTRSARP